MTTMDWSSAVAVGAVIGKVLLPSMKSGHALEHNMHLIVVQFPPSGFLLMNVGDVMYAIAEMTGTFEHIQPSGLAAPSGEIVIY